MQITANENQEKKLYQQNPSLFKVLPNVINPAFTDNDSAGASFSSEGGEADHKQDGAVLSAAARLASTNSWMIIINFISMKSIYYGEQTPVAKTTVLGCLTFGG